MMPFGLLIYFKFSNEILKRSDFLNEKIAKSKQKEINDSINYAKKIQEAMLVSEDYLKETLPKSFIFYQPKDIVSGDFYWAHKDDTNIFFSVSDCTGHGVPGALMSMIGTTLLNEIIDLLLCKVNVSSVTSTKVPLISFSLISFTSILSPR